MTVKADIREYIIWNVNHNHWSLHVAMCQGISQRTLYHITSHASNQSKQGLVIVIHYYVPMLCSLASWLAVINLYITSDGDVTKVWVHVGSVSLIAGALGFISLPVYESARRTAAARSTTWLIVYCVWPVGQLPRWATDWHMRWWLDSQPSVWSVTAHTIPANHLIYSSYRTPLPGAT